VDYEESSFRIINHINNLDPAIPLTAPDDEMLIALAAGISARWIVYHAFHLIHGTPVLCGFADVPFDPPESVHEIII
jgi:hypothetical protein